MTKHFFLLLILVFFAQGNSQSEENKMGLIETEYAFAASAKEKGVRDAFLKFIDDEGIIFKPHPVKGKEYYTGAEKSPGFLLWYPSYSVISSAGDLGVNTGPWEYKSRMKDESIAFGQFVSVWRRHGNGEFKFVIDFGNSHAKPQTEAQAITGTDTRVVRSATDQMITSVESREIIIELEKKLSQKSAEEGSIKAYKNLITANTRYLTDGTEPIFGSKILDTLKTNSPYLTWEPVDGMGSISNDFGYSYGRADVWMDSGMKEKESSRYYMHVWEKVDNKWKLLIEVNSTIPE